MKNFFKNKNILITAGPTWVAVDKVRVITNIFGGALGSIIAQKGKDVGAKVTLLMGPGRAILPKENKNFRIIKFKYYDELLDLIKKEVGSKKYDIVIHSSAVADYKPVLTKEPKIKSGKKNLIIKLKPTAKIVDLIKKLDPKIFLVKFKLEVNLTERQLIDVAYKSMKASKADLIVANDFKTVIKSHKAFIIDNDKKVREINGKDKIAGELFKVLESKLK